MIRTIEIKTTKKDQMINITNHITKFIEELHIKNGIVYIHIPHTTAAVTINENADPDVVDDIIYGLNKLIPNIKEFKHYEANSDAHIKSSLFGPTLHLIVNNSQLVLGTWQGIYFCEFDGPRSRKAVLSAIGV